MVRINAHDRPINQAGITDPLVLDCSLLDRLDAEIGSVLGPERMIVPDDVRGPHAPLREAVLAGCWPTLSSARGKLFFVFDVPDDISERYRTGHPSLEGRVMFGHFRYRLARGGDDSLHDPIVDGGRIRERVKTGYIIRTRSDADTVEARTGDHWKATAAAVGGTQSFSTDYYPNAPHPLGVEFEAALPNGQMQRCNPVRRPDWSSSDCD